LVIWGKIAPLARTGNQAYSEADALKKESECTLYFEGMVSTTRRTTDGRRRATGGCAVIRRVRRNRSTGSTIMDFILPVGILVVLAVGLGYYYIKQMRSH
jgi:hypothetical protein